MRFTIDNRFEFGFNGGSPAMVSARRTEMFEYVVFGIIDNAVMIFGAMTGYEVEKYLPKQFQKGLGTVFGAGIGNALSDFLGGAGSGSWDLAFGTAFGCLIGLIFIPMFVYIGKLRRLWKR